MRNWQSYRDLFDNGLRKGFLNIDSMQYGSSSQVFMIAIANDGIYKVLCSNGQPSP